MLYNKFFSFFSRMGLLLAGVTLRCTHRSVGQAIKWKPGKTMTAIFFVGVSVVFKISLYC